MLLLPKLIAFCDNYITTRPNLEASIVVANDDEVAPLIVDLSNADDRCTLITVIPSHDSELKSEDARRLKNNLLFFIVKKTDAKAGNDHRLNCFTICQVETQALLNYILNLRDTSTEDCLFQNIDYTNTPITPVSNYFNQNGYILEIATYTDF